MKERTQAVPGDRNVETKRRKPEPSRVRPVRAWRERFESPAPIRYERGLFLTAPMRERSQTFNPVTGKWVKWDDTTGRRCSVKKDGKPFHRIKKRKPGESPLFPGEAG
jgi:hypothetical protein